MSDLSEIKKIRKMLKLNEKWESLSPSNKGVKLQIIFDNYFLNHKTIESKEFSQVVSNLKENLEKEDLVINNHDADGVILRYISLMKLSANSLSEEIDFLLIHFSDCDYIVEIFCVPDSNGKLSPYYSLSLDDKKYRSQLRTYLNEFID